MNIFYKLDENKNPVVCTTDEWSEAMEANKLTIRETIDDYIVSTIFLGLNYNHGEGPPLLFETMIFCDCEHDGSMWRYSTWDEALVGHNNAVLKVKFYIEKKKLASNPILEDGVVDSSDTLQEKVK